MRAGPLLLMLALFLGACGPDAGVWVRVEAPLRVPEEADGLRLTVRRASGAVALEQTWDLAAVGDFPQTLALYEEQLRDPEAGALELEVWVLHQGAPAASWAHATARTSLRDGRMEEVVLKVCDCGETP